MSTPTKEAIIGTFINGRNAQDDFLQLATNHGGTVFAWIDYQGILQGTFATASNLAAGEVGFGSSTNTLIGDPGLTWDNVGENLVVSSGTNSAIVNGTQLSLVNTAAATNILNQNSPSLLFTGQTWSTIVSPHSETTTFSIQNLNGILQIGQNAGVSPSQFPVQFNAQVQFSNIVLFNSPIDVAFQTGNAGGVYAITAAANAVGNLTTYTMTAVGSGAQPQPGQNITIAGFVTHASNNGFFVVQSATTSSITVYNSSGIAETHTATGTLDGNYDASIGQYAAQLGVISASNFPISGTSYIPNNVFNAYPNAPLFVMNLKGDAQDAAYVRILNDGVTGNHGLEIGGIIDGTGAAPVALQLGHFNGTSSAVLNVPLTVKGAAPTGSTGQLSVGATTATSASTGANGDVPAQVVGYLIFDLAGTKIKVPYYAT